MSARLPIPKQIVVHGFLFSRGEKMSKSVGNVIAPADLAARYGIDQVNIDLALPIAREHQVGVLAKRPIDNAAYSGE